MAHLQYMPGDPRLVDQLVYELKSKGIFDQFRKDCIADVDTRPAYQNLRQRVETSVSTFLSRQTWQPDLNKNQLREKLRKHILDGNYLEQGVERIVDQVVNPKVASVFIPKVEDLVYNYLGIPRKKSVTAETSNGKVEDLLPNDLEAVSPGSVKSNDDKDDAMEVDEPKEENKMEIDDEKLKVDIKEDSVTIETEDKEKTSEIKLPSSESSQSDNDKSSIPLPTEEIKPEDIPPPENSPPKVELEKIELPKEPIISTDIPLPDDVSKDDKDQYFKTINSEEDDSSSDSSLRRNMSPLTPIRNFNNENSSDAQQAFENDLVDPKPNDKKEPSSFRFAIEAKSENSSDAVKTDKKETEINLSYQFNNQVNINNFNTPLYDDSSNSNNLQIDYESDANSKVTVESKLPEIEQNSEESKKERKPEEKRSSHKSSHRSRDSHKHSSSKDKRSDSKHSSSRDSSRHDRRDKTKSSKEESKTKSSDKERSRDRSDKKDSRDSSRHRSSHKSSHKDSKSHRSSSSSHRHSSKNSDEKKSSSSSSNQKDKDKSSDKNSMDKPRDSKDSKSSSHRSDKDRKSSSKSDKSSSKSKHDDKDKDKKSKKETDDHYSLSGRGNPNRRSTDRDSNDGSSSSKGSHNQSSSKTSGSRKEKDGKSSSKSESTTPSDSTSPSDKENIVREHGTKAKELLLQKPIVRIESHLEIPVSSPPRLPFVPDVTIRKPKFAANLEEAKRLMKMRKFLDEEQKRMNQEAALLLEFQANVRPSMSQAYSHIPGPELEFACITNSAQHQEMMIPNNERKQEEMHYTNNQLLTMLNDEKSNEAEPNSVDNKNSTENNMNKTTVSKDNENGETVSEIVDEINKENDTKNETHDNVVEEFEDKVNVAEIESIDETKSSKLEIDNDSKDLTKPNKQDAKPRTDFEITVIAEELSESEDSQSIEDKKASKTEKIDEQKSVTEDENNLYYFAEHEKYDAEIERAKFDSFFKEFNIKSAISDKIYLINCDTYEENILRDVSKTFGEYEIVNYHRNGHLKLPQTKNVIKNVNLSTEISLTVERDHIANDSESLITQNMFSPDKSDCSFELSSDYDAKLEEMVNKTSRQQIMEIILGGAIDESPSEMPQIDYLTDSNIDSEYEHNLKRKMSDVETTVNNNRHVLTPNKIRKLSTDQITSTTQDNEERETVKLPNITRSKYLGKARRVGLPRPRKSVLPNSPSSDKSVENYEQNTPKTPQTPNGKIKQRSKVQRYDTSDLYKPKLHFLSRRNHIT